MEPVGILLSGYDEEEAACIQALLKGLLATEVLVVGASGQGGETVASLLAQGPEGHFGDEPVKILLFLGFSETQIRAVLEGFPRAGTPRRPIFCALTEQNSRWSLAELSDHLLAEHRRWTAKGQAGA